MTTLYLVRHAAPVQDFTQPPDRWLLSPEGEAQAEALSREPFWQSVRAVYTSPEPKALATVAPAARRYGLPLRAVDCLREVARPGGQRFDDYPNVVAQYLATPKGNLNGWEPNARVRGRIGACVWRLLDPEQNPDAAGPIVVASHGLALTLLLATIQNQAPSFALWQSMRQPDWAKVEVYTEGCMVRGELVVPFSGARAGLIPCRRTSF
ncbi:MAG: histidine phosphatase family protein [Symbiobacteriia bacterium]